MSMPLEIRLSHERDALLIHWENGETSRLSAAKLRAATRAAGALRAALDGVVPLLPDTLRIVDVKPVGAYAVNLFFSDGHDRGIYPWSLLRTLADENDTRNFSPARN